MHTRRPKPKLPQLESEVLSTFSFWYLLRWFDLAAIHADGCTRHPFADVEGTSTGSSCSEAIIVFSWFRKLVPIPRRGARFSLRCGQCVLIEKLDKVFCEQNVQCPIDRHTYFLFQARQFAPVDSPPEKPSQESRKVYAENTRDTCAATNRSTRAKRFKTESHFRSAVNGRDNVLRNNFAFARSMLRRGRTIFARRWIGDQCAIAQGPDAIDALDFKVTIYLDAAALFRTWHNIQNRIWRDARGPDEC